MTCPGDTVTGEVLRITYHDPISAYTVAKLATPKKKRDTAIIGYMPLIQVGQSVTCQGTWEFDKRHGRQFSVKTFTYEFPTDPRSIIRLLSSGFLKGIGPVFAEKIVNHFGDQTFTVLNTLPEQLYNVKGLGKKRADTLIASWQERTQLQELFVLLCNWGITQSQTLKILKRWGNTAIQTIRENPYKLAKEIHGIGFHVADRIAERLGIDRLSAIRIDAAIEFFLWELSQDGHTCFPLAPFLELAQTKLQSDSETIKERLIALFQQADIVLFTPKNENEMYVALKLLYVTEQKIAQHFNRLLKEPTRLRQIDIQKAIVWAAQTLNMSFATKQADAISCALSNKVSIITGGPGTGKSTITRAIVSILSKLTKHIILVAPTGRAAKRLAEMTGHYSQTIHRLLKFNPSTRSFAHNRENPLNCDLIIIDEASMIDTYLTLALLEALPNHARCIFIGDSDQLPSIGPGNVLKDCIECQQIPFIRLNEIFRQASHSLIIKNAHRINSGQMPYLIPDRSDCRFIEQKEPEGIRSTILQMVTQLLPASFGLDPKKDVQILAPMRRGECGIDRLNIDLQTYFLQGQQKRGPFAIGDKIIQLKNNYQKEVFNGDIGFVTNIDESYTLTIDYDGRIVSYTSTELDEIALAWAVSIHKYQGSECPCVIIPVHTQHFKLLNKNLIYTAVTRGKKLVILVGSVKAIAIAVNTANANMRWTNLKEAINGSMSAK